MSETDCSCSSAVLIEQALLADEGYLSNEGTLVISGGTRKGRSPQDSYIVDEPSSTEDVWWNPYNQKLHSNAFDLLWDDVESYMAETSNYENTFHIGADNDHYLAVRVVTDTAWQNLYAAIMFIRPDLYNPEDKQEWELMCARGFQCVPERHQTHSEAAVIINFSRRKVLIAGMDYAGEIKRAMFCVQSFLLPEKDILPMHCSANADTHGNTCLFFGLSGTGKTTLSTHSARQLIGDDEHAWGKGGLFNLEGGCYAKVIGLKPTNASPILKSVRFGSIAENVVLDPLSRIIDFENNAHTNNTRCAYPLSFLPNWGKRRVYAEPDCIIFLSYDLLGVLPPVSLLTKEAAEYHYLSGYTARVASTENDDESRLQPVFSPGYGAPFMTRRPEEYAELFMRRMEEFGSKVYLLNVGYFGGSANAALSEDKGFIKGSRYSLPCTQELVKAIQAGDFLEQPMIHLDALNLSFPADLPEAIRTEFQIEADPRKMWSSTAAYQRMVEQLAQQFRENFKQFDIDVDIIEAGP